MSKAEPNDWETRALKNILAADFPGAWGGDPASGIANACVLRSTNIDDDGHLDYSTGAKRVLASRDLVDKKLSGRDILLEASGGGPGKPVGRVALFTPPDNRAYVCSNFFRTLRPLSTVDSGFLAWYLQRMYQQPSIWQFQQQTTGIINLKYRDYLRQPVRFPEFREQRRIAEILDTADEVIRSTKRLVEKLEQEKRGLLHDLLNCGVNEFGRLRDPHGEAQAFVGDNLEHIPTTWRRRSFGELAKYVNGNAFDVEGWAKTGYPIIRIQNLNGSASFNFYDGPVDPNWLVQAGDLLFAWSGTRGSSFGPTIWPGPQGVLNQHIFKVYENNSFVTRGFLYLLLEHNLGRIAASAHGFKDSFVHVKRGELTSVEVNVPPIEEQRGILQVANSADDLIEAESRKLKRLRLLRTGLMDDLLTGRVRVGALA